MCFLISAYCLCSFRGGNGEELPKGCSAVSSTLTLLLASGSAQRGSDSKTGARATSAAVHWGAPSSSHRLGSASVFLTHLCEGTWTLWGHFQRGDRRVRLLNVIICCSGWSSLICTCFSLASQEGDAAVSLEVGGSCRCLHTSEYGKLSAFPSSPF